MVFIQACGAAAGAKDILMLVLSTVFYFLLSYLIIRILIAHTPDRIKIKEENKESERVKTKYNKQKKIVIAVSLLFSLVFLFVGKDVINIIKGVCFANTLLFASLCDIQRREIKDGVSGAVILIGLCAIQKTDLITNFVSAFVMFAFMFVFAMLFYRKIGGADIKIMGACTFVCGPVGGIIGTMLGLLASIIITPIVNKNKDKEHKKTMPLVPYLAFGYTIAFILSEAGLNYYLLNNIL